MRTPLPLILLLLFVITSCAKKEESSLGDYKLIKINGILEGTRPQEIILYQLGGLRPEPIDTAKVSADNTFQLEVLIDKPEIYVMNIYGVHVFPIILEDADLTIEASGMDRAKLVTITGSEDMEMLTSFNKAIQEFQMKEFDMQKLYTDAVIAGNSELAEQYVERSIALSEEKQELIRTLVEEMGVSLATLPAIDQMDKDLHFEFLSDLTAQLMAKYPESEDVQSLNAMLEQMAPVALGKIAPDIQLPDTEGNVVSLKDFRGKYLLIDFWAAWCKPCRRENPNIVAAYHKYQSKGFDVLGVSLDRTREQWLKAIQEDELPWKQVSDLKYFNSEAAANYNVNAIPFSVLLDKDGVIIAKNLRGRKLEQKLTELFGNS